MPEVVANTLAYVAYIGLLLVPFVSALYYGYLALYASSQALQAKNIGLFSVVIHFFAFGLALVALGINHRAGAYASLDGEWIRLSGGMMLGWQWVYTPTTLGLAAFTLFISALTQAYSRTYLDFHQPCRAYMYYARMGLFSAAMLGFILSTTLWSVLLFMSLMSICSYALIGQKHEKTAVRRAASQSYLIGKVGDLALLASLAILCVLESPYGLEGGGGEGGEGGITSQLSVFCGALLVLAGLVKAAQIPFTTWLLRAMQAEMPVSALLHSATLVATGVILTAKFSFLLTPFSKDVLLVAGLFSSCLCGCLACLERHAKKLLAYSTAAQLGLAFCLIALGATQYALFFLVIHGMAKAILFLGTGRHVRYVATHAPTLVAKKANDLNHLGLGSLGWRQSPWSSLACLCATCSLIGMPFFIGSQAKTLLLSTALTETAGVGFALFFALALSQVYLGRFLGKLFARRSPWLRDSISPSPPPLFFFFTFRFFVCL